LCFILTSTVFAFSKNDMKFNKNDFKWNKSANYMKDKGIMKGYSDGDFGFADYVKRGDITVMVVRAFQISSILNIIEEKFPDVPVDSYYYEAIATAKYYNIAKGDGKNFNPKKFVTIKDAIALVERSAAVANKHVTVHDVDLNKLFSKKDLDSFATRDDIAKMLYYVLTGDIYEEDDNDEKDELIVYETEKGVKIDFKAKDFVKVFDDLDYVKFTIPSSDKGKLYYGYESSTKYDSTVKSTTKYYVDSDSNNEISEVTFIPNSKYTGSFYIDYKAYGEEDVFTGRIKIVVKEGKVVLNDIKYEIERESNSVKFIQKHFEKVLNNIHEDFIEDDFDYVKFELPQEKYGKLYYDYKSTSKDNSLVTESNKYDIDDLGKITFVQNDDYAGEVLIKYTIYDDSGNTYIGTIKINIEEELVLNTIKYTIGLDKVEVNFDEDDFEDVLGEVIEDFDEDEFTVKFELPLEKYGKLYYDYKSTSNNNSLVIENKEYELDELGEITFVANSKYTGIVYIEYVALHEDGNSYSGVVRIKVK
ncbi:MAG: S-layer homology domain-containing protein, partial [Tissierellia bacterium]|nr:S-layer homology domain-containing protein [Tissierellia bacterium]